MLCKCVEVYLVVLGHLACTILDNIIVYVAFSKHHFLLLFRKKKKKVKVFKKKNITICRKQPCQAHL